MEVFGILGCNKSVNTFFGGYFLWLLAISRNCWRIFQCKWFEEKTLILSKIFLLKISRVFSIQVIKYKFYLIQVLFKPSSIFQRFD